jgi:hypothetical protein
MTEDTTASPGMTRRSAITKAAIGAGAIWAAPAVLSIDRALATSGTGSPGGMTNVIVINGQNVNTHTYSLNYTCGGGGVVNFTGTGTDPQNDPETISGWLSTGDGSFSYTSDYHRGDGYMYTVTGSGTVGASTLDYNNASGVDTQGTHFDVNGSFTGIPIC